jgi:hypothetical protein
MRPRAEAFFITSDTQPSAVATRDESPSIHEIVRFIERSQASGATLRGAVAEAGSVKAIGRQAFSGMWFTRTHGSSPHPAEGRRNVTRRLVS